jgi:hypothetical protein
MSYTLPSDVDSRPVAVVGAGTLSRRTWSLRGTHRGAPTIADTSLARMKIIDACCGGDGQSELIWWRMTSRRRQASTEAR